MASCTYPLPVILEPPLHFCLHSFADVVLSLCSLIYCSFFIVQAKDYLFSCAFLDFIHHSVSLKSLSTEWPFKLALFIYSCFMGVYLDCKLPVGKDYISYIFMTVPWHLTQKWTYSILSIHTYCLDKLLYLRIFCWILIVHALSLAIQSVDHRPKAWASVRKLVRNAAKLFFWWKLVER